MADIFDTGAEAAVADERTTLAAFLDYYRKALVAKMVGVSEEDARRRLVLSATTLAGLVKHLSRVEMSWFQHRLAQIPLEDLPELRRLLDEPGSEFRLEDHESMGVLVDRYQRQCEISREVAARFELDHVVPHPALGEVSARWITVHMIEETARHVGHADILREQIDGTVAD